MTASIEAHILQVQTSRNMHGVLQIQFLWTQSLYTWRYHSTYYAASQPLLSGIYGIDKDFRQTRWFASKAQAHIHTVGMSSHYAMLCLLLVWHSMASHVTLDEIRQLNNIKCVLLQLKGREGREVLFELANLVEKSPF